MNSIFVEKRLTMEFTLRFLECHQLVTEAGVFFEEFDVMAIPRL